MQKHSKERATAQSQPFAAFLDATLKPGCLQARGHTIDVRHLDNIQPMVLSVYDDILNDDLSQYEDPVMLARIQAYNRWWVGLTPTTREAIYTHISQTWASGPL